MSEKTSKKSVRGRNGGTLNPGYNGQKITGRPKGAVNWSTVYNKLLSLEAPEQLLAEIRKINPKAKKNYELLAVSTFNRALKGNPKAIDTIHHYAGGKPIEQVELSGQVEVDLYQNLSKEELKRELDKLGLSDKLFDK
jgi:hypothetical protein